MKNFSNAMINIIYVAILIFVIWVNFDSQKYIYSIFMFICLLCYMYNLKKIK